MQEAGREPTHARGGALLLLVAFSMIALIALAGVALCALYLSGTGRVAWFVVLLLLMLCALACPSLAVVKGRNLKLLSAALYVPLGLWSFLYCLAPGTRWENTLVSVGGSACLLGLGLLCLYLFLRDLRTLPRY
jgi:hypothetical protein